MSQSPLCANLRRDIGSLLWIGFEGCELTPQLRESLKAGDAGGVTLFARNIPKEDGEAKLDALKALCADIHQSADSSGHKILISVDQEGGRVQRIKAPLEHYPPMLHLANLADTEAVSSARLLGEKMGRELKALGFDISFAPVLDVHTNPDNPIIGDRAFSHEAEGAAIRALAYAEGLKGAGILACGKHFPGHGDTESDSHLQLPRLVHEMERLEAIELLPFARAVEANIPMLMTAHVVFEALDPNVPGTLSPKVVGELLREKMGYEGVIVSDDLDMKAISDNFGVGEAAVLAIEAGCDVLLLCRNLQHQEEARKALHQKAETNGEFRGKIAQAAARVVKLAAQSVD